MTRHAGLYPMNKRWIMWLILGGPVVVLIAGWLLTR
jgi:hypothetical protein